MPLECVVYNHMHIAVSSWQACWNSRPYSNDHSWSGKWKSWGRTALSTNLVQILAGYISLHIQYQSRVLQWSLTKGEMKILRQESIATNKLPLTQASPSKMAHKLTKTAHLTLNNSPLIQRFLVGRLVGTGLTPMITHESGNENLEAGKHSPQQAATNSSSHSPPTTFKAFSFLLSFAQSLCQPKHFIWISASIL